jgi:nucleoside-diphosphate-sugar epimerase
MQLKDKRVLITGANGFIGGRLAERLTNEEGAIVRGLVRVAVGTFYKTSQQIGDITDVAAVTRAVDGCDIVVHCAAMQSGRSKIDEYRRINVGGTLNLLRAAKNANVQRFVHISTINVHGFPPPPDAHADSPLGRDAMGRGAINRAPTSGGFYSITKAEGERAAWQFAKNYQLPITVIRPGCTFGPRSVAWTLTPLNRVRRGTPVLIGDGNGICNAVYIDNLIDLILLALKNDPAIGQAFIGAEGRGVTWREFYGAYARMAGVAKINSMPRWFARLAATGFGVRARFDGYPPRVDRASVEFYSHRVVFDIEKSKRLLGYEPRVSFEEGMARTEKWLRDENILQK